MRDTAESRFKILAVASIILFGISFTCFILSMFMGFDGILTKNQIVNLIICVVSIVPSTVFSVLHYQAREKANKSER